MPTDIATPVAHGELTRRRLLAIGGLALGTLVIPGCGDDGSGQETSDGYPRVIDTPEGTTTLDTKPQRVALTNGRRLFPFLMPFLEGAEFQVVGFGNTADLQADPWIPRRLLRLPNSPDTDGPEVERYATWRPDVILANDNVGDVFEPLEQVGPVVRLPETDWRRTTQILGDVFDRPDVAPRVIADTEAVIAEARRDPPVRAAVFSRYATGGNLGFQVEGAELPNFLGELGIEVAPSATAQGGYEDVSLERLAGRLADVDWAIVLNFGTDLQDSLLAEPLYRATAVARAGRVVVFDQTQTGAGFPASPPSMPTIIEAVRPVLQA